MAPTTHQPLICKNATYKTVVFRAKDFLAPYRTMQINLRKIAVEEFNLKLNHQLQNNRCMCEKCNPLTSGMD